MSNTLTALAPYLFSAAKEVANEPSGALGSINMNFDNKGVAKGDSIIVPVAPVAAEGDYTPAMTTTAGTDKTAASIEVSIDYSKSTSWNLTGEEMRSLENATSDKEWVRQLIAQGMRTLRNAAEVRLCDAIYQGASRATGTAGTTPFASSLNEIADIQTIFLDNGAPFADPYLIINSAAFNQAMKLSIVQSASHAGSDEERRKGILYNQFGFNVKVSSGIQLHTKGTATGMDCTAIEPVAETTIAVDGSDSGTILAGDIITRGNEGGSSVDGNKYVVHSATASGAASGNIVVGSPGLKVATTVADEWTIGNNYTPNIAFERNAVVGVMRPPLIPASPIINQIQISDDRGLTYLLCEIVGDGMKTWRLHLCYGFKVINSEFIAILMG
jgi:hypothetical protein